MFKKSDNFHGSTRAVAVVVGRVIKRGRPLRLAVPDIPAPQRSRLAADPVELMLPRVRAIKPGVGSA